MKYKQRLLNQQRLGQLFGVSSHVVRRWLEEVGLRDASTKKPTRDAHLGGYCDSVAGGYGCTWLWVAEEVVPRLIEAGHPLAPELPAELAEPSPLHGPFSVESNNPIQVVNGDGSPAVRATTAKNAEAVAKLLNLAHRHGKLAEWLA